MIKILLGALLFLVAPFEVCSQKNSTEALHPKLLLRFNILGLADPTDQNLSFGVEHYFNSRWSVGTDAGWIFRSNYVENIKSVNGVIVRPFLRYYAERNHFLEGELHYKYVSYNLEDWIGRIPVNNVPTYEEYTNFHLNKYAAGLHIKWGLQANISRNDRFMFEFTSGPGIRFKWHKVRDGIYTTGGRINNISAETTVGAVFLVNFRLAYTIK